jgi:hypothetical protein
MLPLLKKLFSPGQAPNEANALENETIKEEESQEEIIAPSGMCFCHFVVKCLTVYLS